MAKIKEKLVNHYLSNKIKALKHKIAYNEAYPTILEEKLEAKKQEKLAQQKEIHRKILLSLEKETLTSDQFLNVFTKASIDTLDEKIYWKKRALSHKLSKHKEKDSNNHVAFEKSHLEKLKALEVWYEDKKKAILERYHIEEKSADELKINQKLYQSQKVELEEKLKVYEKTLSNINKEKLDQFKAKTHARTKRLKEKLATLKETKARLTKDHLDDMLSGDEILRLDNLTMRFGGLVAVDQLSFSVKKGEIFGLIGPNGAGKTTVFNCITQFYKTPEGHIYYRDRNEEVLNLNDVKVHDIIRQGIVRTFQNVELIWELSILDNLLVASHSLYQTGFFQHLIHTPRFKREEAILKSKALKILEDLGLILYKDVPPFGLPYGMLKSIEFARTLMTDPKLIILDEPAAGLNEAETKQLAASIRKIQKSYDCTIFLVEHDMGLVMDLCDTICAISFGKKLAIGTPSEIQSSKIVQEAYLGGE